MKRKCRTLIAALLSLSLLTGLLTLPANGSGTVYFMAVNETFVEMTSGNMPIVVRSALYIPYTMLSPQATGISLGVRTQYNASRRVLTVTDDVRTVTFDLASSTAYDDSGSTLTIRAAARNSMAYIPLSWLCSYFSSLSYSLIRTQYGTLVRVTNSAVILTDAQFVDAAMDRLQNNLLRYQESLAPSPSPSPSPSAGPGPSPSTAPSLRPAVLLALRSGPRTEEALEALESRGAQGLFLFFPDELAAYAPLLRRITAGGHSVGLILAGADPAACLAQLAAGRAALAALTYSCADIVCAGQLAPEDTQVLMDAGCVLWPNDALDASSLSASALTRRLQADEVNCVEYLCDEEGLTALSAALRVLSDEEAYRLCPAVVTMLPGASV